MVFWLIGLVLFPLYRKKIWNQSLLRKLGRGCFFGVLRVQVRASLLCRRPKFEKIRRLGPSLESLAHTPREKVGANGRPEVQIRPKTKRRCCSPPPKIRASPKQAVIHFCQRTKRINKSHLWVTLRHVTTCLTILWREWRFKSCCFFWTTKIDPSDWKSREKWRRVKVRSNEHENGQTLSAPAFKNIQPTRWIFNDCLTKT